MSRAARQLLTAVLACTAVALPVTAATAPTVVPSAATACDTPWGSTVERVDEMGGGPLTEVRTGRHDCFDRVVYTLAGPPVGYYVEYVDQVTQDGSGKVIPVPGDARLLVRLHHPAYDDSGTQTLVPPATAGRPVADVTGYEALRSVVYASSFEGDTVLGVGVRARLPFRALVLDGPGGGARLVLDVAHRWT
ncbi:AMIN-like domain-containing (lipo)protein [Pseudonocardia sichuanensis]